MGQTRLPAYTIEREGRFFWQRPSWANPENANSDDPKKRRLAVRNGKTCPLESEALGDDKGAAITKADAINEAFREWCKGVDFGPVQGSVAWLFYTWYKETKWYKTKGHKTRKDYDGRMKILVETPTKDGRSTLGKVMASKIDAPAADSLYEKLCEERGMRSAAYCMAVCKLVWNKAMRPGYSKDTGVTANPFIGMGVSTAKGDGNRQTSRAEYNLYRKAAHDLGFHSMATAAALCFEGCQRVWDAFGYPDPDGRKVRGFVCGDYRPGVSIRLKQSKTGNYVNLPLTIDVDGEKVALYPELEEELTLARAAERDAAEKIVVEERNGQPYKERRVSTVHRLICEHVGLPKEMTFTGFRHGGITEIGDSGEADPRAVSGHKTLSTTTVYNKATEAKARRIAQVRREHIKMLEAEEEE